MPSTSTIEFRCARYAPAVDDGAEPGQERREVLADQPAERGEAAVRGVDRPPKPFEERLQSGAAFSAATRVGLSSRAAGRSCCTSGTAVAAKRFSRARVARDSRWKVGQDPEQLGELLVSAGGGRETARNLDQATELCLAFGERLEDGAAIVNQLTDGSVGYPGRGAGGSSPPQRGKLGDHGRDVEPRPRNESPSPASRT